jgi:hypothetical protein
MHLCRSWLLLGVCAAALLPAAGGAMTVYKWTDAQGVVHYSDQPVDGAQKIVTSGGAGHNGIMADSTPSAAKPPAEAKKTLADTRISIASPAPDQTFVGNDPIQVRLSMNPSLQPGQQVAWTLNGAAQSQAPPDSMELTLTDLARGVYTVEATVTDTATGESKSADPVTFNVVRPSVLSPQHK